MSLPMTPGQKKFFELSGLSPIEQYAKCKKCETKFSIRTGFSCQTCNTYWCENCRRDVFDHPCNFNNIH
jgi:hypothetical protein